MNILFTVPFTKKYARKFHIATDSYAFGIWVFKCRVKLTRIRFGWVLIAPLFAKEIAA